MNLSNAMANKLDDAYNRTEASGKENYVAVGKQGKLSVTVEGSEGEVNFKQIGIAKSDFVTPPPANTIGGTGTVQTNRTIGFYNKAGSIITTGFNSLLNAIKKINK